MSYQQMVRNSTFGDIANLFDEIRTLNQNYFDVCETDATEEFDELLTLSPEEQEQKRLVALGLLTSLMDQFSNQFDVTCEEYRKNYKNNQESTQ
jgi:hypothetical protein